MARGGKRVGAGRKPNPHKGKTASPEELKIPPRTTYEPWIATQAQKLSFHGATDLEIADFFGITTETFYRWRNEHVDFCAAVRVGKEMSDARVEKSLYNRAIGYTFVSEKIAINAKGEVTRVQIREHVPPDPGAALNWLKNRRPMEWREKTETVLTGPNGGPIEIRSLAELSDEELDTLERIGSKVTDARGDKGGKASQD